MSRSAPQRPTSAGRLRHPAELPFFVFMVVLNVLIIILIIRAAMVLPFLPERYHEGPGATAVRSRAH